MPKRQAGALFIMCGVVLALVATAVVIVGGTAVVAVGGPAYVLLVACVGLLGVGVALLGASGPIFGGTLARRALKTLAFGLVGDAAILGLLSLPGLQGSNMIILFMPFFLFGWATIIGAVLTVLALLTAGGRFRLVGAMFLAAAVALFLVNAWVADSSGSEGGPVLAIALAVVAGAALVLGFVGLAWLAWDSAPDTVVVERTGEGNIG